MPTKTVAIESDEATQRDIGQRRRIWEIDALRGVALLAMASYHFSWDLEYFGYLDPGTVGHGAFKIYARAIASSFLFLAGISLVLGHTPRVRVRVFAIRFAKVAGAALVITIATWFAFRDSFIFFGILHAIAAASLIGLLFLRLPSAVTLLFAAAVLIAPFYLRSAIFDMPVLLWVGLSEHVPRSNDYVPLLPWLAPFLAGIASARLAFRLGWFERLGGGGPAQWKRVLTGAGRHSLIIYLVHQPLLFGLVYLFALGFPAAKPDPADAFQSNCVATCSQNEDIPFCTRFCGCTLDQLQTQDLFTPLNEGKIDTRTDDRIGRIARQCTIDAQTKG